jgi:uncharacterized membrane protein YeaQ/YmgE (transglycosylase-associated protein family)
MVVIGLIIFGFFVGLVARFIMPGRDSMGFIATSLLGIIGSFVGAYIGQTLGLYPQGSPVGFLMATLGAVIVLFIYNILAKG